MKILRPLKAIRARCLECCAGQAHEVRLCPAKECPLWHYRMGHKPKPEDYNGETIELVNSLPH